MKPFTEQTFFCRSASFCVSGIKKAPFQGAEEGRCILWGEVIGERHVHPTRSNDACKARDARAVPVMLSALYSVAEVALNRAYCRSVKSLHDAGMPAAL